MIVLASLSLLIWLVLAFGRSFFWRISLEAILPATPCYVVAVIPARNESDVILESVQSLLGQEFPGRLEIVVVDDNSSDGTGALAHSCNVTVINGTPLSAGWTGKLWAMQQGINEAEKREPDYFLFTDADIRHDPHNLAQLVGLAQANNLDMASHMVKLHCSTWAEKFTIPAFVFFFFKLYPPGFKTMGAAGGCVLIRPSMLTKIGGLSSIRGEVIDDCSLAGMVKKHGGKLWLGLTANTKSIRPYNGLEEIGRMISRSAFRQLNHSALLLLGSVSGLLLTYLVPPVLALSGSYLALTAWALMTICYLPMVRFYGLNPLWALTLPATACFYLGATMHSAVSYWRGHGGVWKGRAQDVN